MPKPYYTSGEASRRAINELNGFASIATAPQKNDAVDARLLGRMLLAGLIPEAYPRPNEQRELLRLLRRRTTLVRFRTQLAGRIHAQLHQQRLVLPPEKLLRLAAGGRVATTLHGDIIAGDFFGVLGA